MAQKIKVAPGMYASISQMRQHPTAPNTAMVTARLHVKWWAWPVLFWQTAVKLRYPIWHWPYILWLIAKHSIMAWRGNTGGEE